MPSSRPKPGYKPPAPRFPFARESLALALAILFPGCNDDAPAEVDGGKEMPPDGGADAAPYTEPACPDPLRDFLDLQASYTYAELRETLVEMASRRYPIGVEPIRTIDDTNLARFFPPSTTFLRLLNPGLNVAVHEGTHLWDIRMKPAGQWLYRVRDDLSITTKNLENFGSKEILRFHADTSSDSRAGIYLRDQGFNILLDEFNAYVHSLAVSYCMRDSISGTDARDGALVMMYYTELYLRVARTEHAAAYAAITSDPGHVRLILTLWDRAEFWLKVTAPFRSLGIRDALFASWVYDPDLLAEIHRLK